MILRNIDEVVALANKSAITLVRFLYCDTSSIVRGKATRVDKLKERIESGIGLVKGSMAMNMLDQMQSSTGLGATGEVRLVPDLETWSVLPYCERTASLLCDLKELDHKPWALCPRSLLKGVVEESRRLGFSFQVAFEPEFTLGTSSTTGELIPYDRTPCFSTEGMNKASKIINRLIDSLERQGKVV
jgi:glutamine synthetase